MLALWIGTTGANAAAADDDDVDEDDCSGGFLLKGATIA